MSLWRLFDGGVYSSNYGNLKYIYSSCIYEHIVLLIENFTLFFVAFAHVPETICHLTNNYEYWKQEAEEKVWLSLVVATLLDLNFTAK